MSLALSPEIRNHGASAMALLNQIVEDDPGAPNKHFAPIVGEIVRMRDSLIAAQRSGIDCREFLSRSNAILSAIIGTEFPISGLQWKRVCQARDALGAFLGELPNGDG